MCSIIGGVKLFNHETNQKNRINLLTEKINKMETIISSQNEYFEERFNQTTNYFEYQIDYRENGFNYLAIGNSLTLIKSWGHGICSTRNDNDYFNLLVIDLKNNNNDVVAYPINFSLWEQNVDRKKTLKLLDVYLSKYLDLITIQLGENIRNTQGYHNDLKELIEYVRSKAPKAKIVLIGDWWSIDRNNIRKNVAKETGVLFVDTSRLINDIEYQSKEGTVCEGVNGSRQVVSKIAETHPGDKGMMAIYQGILKVL